MAHVSETYEWDDIWYERTHDADKKRVLYVGDSISRGVRSSLNRLGEGEILFDNAAGSKALDDPNYDKLMELVIAQEPKRPDLILFNNGLHGFHLGTEEYENLLEEKLKLIVSLSGVKPAVVLTTAVKDAKRNESTVIPRNAAAKRVARRLGLAVIDLFGFTEDMPRIGDGVHFEPADQPKLAGFILEKVKELLG